MVRNYEGIHKCIKCGEEFETHARNAKYCIPCRKDDFISPLKHLNTGIIGSIGGLIISVDLFKRGYEVFRALSPTCSCDLVIIKEGVRLRVEVRSFSKYRNFRDDNKNKKYFKSHVRADVLAIFIHTTGEIIYIPNI